MAVMEDVEKGLFRSSMLLIMAIGSDCTASVGNSLSRSAICMSLTIQVAADTDGNVGVEKGLCTWRLAMSLIKAVGSHCTATARNSYTDQLCF